MHSMDGMAPWQIAPVSLTSRIAAAALAVLSLVSVFTWQATPNSVLAAALTIIPALVAIRVIRGFPRATAAAGATFAGLQLLALIGLTVLRGPTQPIAAFTVAAAVATAGLASVLTGWLNSRRTPVIALTRTNETRVAVRARNA